MSTIWIMALLGGSFTNSGGFPAGTCVGFGLATAGTRVTCEAEGGQWVTQAPRIPMALPAEAGTEQGSFGASGARDGTTTLQGQAAEDAKNSGASRATPGTAAPRLRP